MREDVGRHVVGARTTELCGELTRLRLRLLRGALGLVRLTLQRLLLERRGVVLRLRVLVRLARRYGRGLGGGRLRREVGEERLDLGHLRLLRVLRRLGLLDVGPARVPGGRGGGHRTDGREGPGGEHDGDRGGDHAAAGAEGGEGIRHLSRFRNGTAGLAHVTLSTDATVTTAVTRRTPPSEGARTPRWWHRGRVGSGTGRRDTPEMHARRRSICTPRRASVCLSIGSARRSLRPYRLVA